MKYRYSVFVNGSRGWNPPFLGTDDFNGIERELMSCPQISAEQFMVSWPLPFSFTAHVYKRKALVDTIVLKMCDSEVEIIRRTDGVNAPVAAFCINGAYYKNIPTEILNIMFRAIDDPFTNKGLVWIWLDLQEASVVFKSIILHHEWLLEKIVREAELAVKKNLLDLFGSVVNISAE